MRQQPSSSCFTGTLVCPLGGYAWRPEDVARLGRIMARPVLFGLAVVILVVSLLFGASALVPYLTAPGVTGPQFQVQSQERVLEEQRVQAQAEAFMASVERSPGDDSPNTHEPYP